MTNNSPVIELKNLSRRYGKLEAVNGLSLTVPRSVPEQSDYP